MSNLHQPCVCASKTNLCIFLIQYKYVASFVTLVQSAWFVEYFDYAVEMVYIERKLCYFCVVKKGKALLFDNLARAEDNSKDR